MHTMPLSAPVENFTPVFPRVRAPLNPHRSLETIRIELDAARALARADKQQHGENGFYATASLYHVLYLDQAHDHLADLNEWLQDHAPDVEMLPGSVPAHSNGASQTTLMPYQLHTYLREMVMALHYARHWAMLSAAYHHSRAATDAFEHITSAIRQIETLSENAGRAFLDASSV